MSPVTLGAVALVCVTFLVGLRMLLVARKQADLNALAALVDTLRVEAVTDRTRWMKLEEKVTQIGNRVR